MSQPAQLFDSLRDEYYRAWFRFHPEMAVELGVPGFAHCLAPYDDDEIGALAGLQEKMLAGLDQIDYHALDDDRQIDYRLLAGQALIEHHELLEQDWRRRDPGRYLPVNAIYQLTVRRTDDPGVALEGRLAQIPEYLRGARSHLKQLPELIPPLWLESACTEAVQGAVYLRELTTMPGISPNRMQQGKLHELKEAAAHALEDYARFLEQELAPVARGGVACGRVHFERLLEQRHFLDLGCDQLRAFGERLFAETGAALRALVQANWPGQAVAQVADGLSSQHPAAEQMLDAYRDQMRAAREFLAGHGLVTLPARESLDVVETPQFLRHQIPFAAYMEPAPDDPEQRGLYYVTPAGRTELLGEHNQTAIRHTCVHEAWPGHHLQFVRANTTPAARSLPRLVNTSATLYEGWALYSEQLMLEQGFMSGAEHEFVLLRDRLWRALRVVIDVDLHCGGLDVGAAVDRMVDELGFPREQAMADVTWYTRAPAVPMGYATGWALINAARNLKQGGNQMDLKDFHDRLLASGSMALSLAVQRNFGAEFWADVYADVFGGDA